MPLPESTDEHIFFGVQEPGIIFRARTLARQNQFNPDITQEYITTYPRFAMSAHDVVHSEVLSGEGIDPLVFNRRFAAAVDAQRVSVEEKKARRAESRVDLRNALFGNNS